MLKGCVMGPKKRVITLRKVGLLALGCQRFFVVFMFIFCLDVVTACSDQEKGSGGDRAQVHRYFF